MYRHNLKMFPSHLYAGGVVLRDMLTRTTVNSFKSKAAALQWARRNGWQLY